MIDWTENWDDALTAAGTSGKPIFCFLYAEG